MTKILTTHKGVIFEVMFTKVVKRCVVVLLIYRRIKFYRLLNKRCLGIDFIL